MREPLQLPLPPLALASAGLFVVAVCDDGVYIFDRNSSRQVQQIEYAHDDAYVGLTQRLPAAADAGGRCICLATSSQVLWLEPVALEQQVGSRARGGALGCRLRSIGQQASGRWQRGACQAQKQTCLSARRGCSTAARYVAIEASHSQAS